jgi:hypothetical protein
VTQSDHQWLSAAPWDSVLAVNKALCQTQKIDPLNNARSYEAARQLWEQAVGKSMSLVEAMDVCHDCHALGPFTFNNGNTFAAIGRTLIDELLKTVPPVEAQILRTTMCHYIVGQIGRKELQQVLRHFEPMLNTAPSAARATPAPARVAPAPQEQRASA